MTMGTKAKPFVPELSGDDGWSEAYDYCREVNKPVVVKHNGSLIKIFPSGHHEVLGRSSLSKDQSTTEQTAWFLNKYRHCGTSWEDEWSCACNDDCPQCGKEIEPYESIDIESEDKWPTT